MSQSDTSVQSESWSYLDDSRYISVSLHPSSSVFCTYQSYAILHPQYRVLQKCTARKGKDPAQLQDVGANEKGVAESIQHGQVKEHAADEVWYGGIFKRAVKRQEGFDSMLTRATKSMLTRATKRHDIKYGSIHTVFPSCVTHMGASFLFTYQSVRPPRRRDRHRCGRPHDPGYAEYCAQCPTQDLGHR